jgi:hypothetical protein
LIELARTQSGFSRVLAETLSNRQLLLIPLKIYLFRNLSSLANLIRECPETHGRQ